MPPCLFSSPKFSNTATFFCQVYIFGHGSPSPSTMPDMQYVDFQVRLPAVRDPLVRLSV